MKMNSKIHKEKPCDLRTDWDTVLQVKIVTVHMNFCTTGLLSENKASKTLFKFCNCQSLPQYKISLENK